MPSPSPAEFLYQHHLAMGGARFWRGEIDEAARYFSAAADIMPSRPEAQHNLGLVLYLSGRPDEAMLRFQAALAADPEFELSQRALATPPTPQSIHLPRALLPVLLAHAKSIPHVEKGAAERMLARMMEIWPHELPIANETARRLFNYRCFSEIEALILGCRPDTPLDWTAKYLLGSAILYQNRPEEALPILREAAALAPPEAGHAAFLPMRVLLALGRAEDAMDEFTRSRHGASVLKASCQGMVLLGLNRLAEAETAFLHSIAMQHGSTVNEPVTGLGLTLLRAGRCDDALARLRQAIGINRDPFALGNLSLGLATCGDAAEAAELRREVERSDKWALPFLDRLRRGLGFS